MTQPDPLAELEQRLTLRLDRLADDLGLVVERLEALREDLEAGRTPTGRDPGPPVPDEQHGLPIPPKRPREPGYSRVRSAWGEVGVYDPAVGGVIESETGKLPDPDRKPRPRRPRKRRERDA